MSSGPIDSIPDTEPTETLEAKGPDGNDDGSVGEDFDTSLAEADNEAPHGTVVVLGRNLYLYGTSLNDHATIKEKDGKISVELETHFVSDDKADYSYIEYTVDAHRISNIFVSLADGNDTLIQGEYSEELEMYEYITDKNLLISGGKGSDYLMGGNGTNYFVPDRQDWKLT
jgi:Ca2+-binding RTX toxin-like protein